MNKIGEILALSWRSKLIQNAPFAIKIYKYFGGGGMPPDPLVLLIPFGNPPIWTPFSVIEPPL